MSLSAMIMMILSLTLTIGGIAVCSVFAFLRKPGGNKPQTDSESTKHE